MGNCLKSQLKQGVNNDNLDVFGELVIQLSNTGIKTNFSAIPCVSMDIEGSGYFTNAQDDNLGQHDTNVASSRDVVGYTDGDLLRIKSKYDLTILQIADSKVFIKRGSDLDLSYCTKLVTINFGNDNKPKFNFENLHNIVVETIRVPGDSFATGRVEKIVENAISNGRNSGFTKICGDYSGLTINNQLFTPQGLDWIYVSYGSNTATIYKGENTSGQVVATYSGGTWTYNS